MPFSSVSLLLDRIDSSSTITSTAPSVTTSKVNNTHHLFSSADRSLSLDCSAPNLQLSPPSAPLSSPLQFFRSEDFAISSTIFHRCNDSLTVNVQWTVYNCTNATMCSSSPIDVTAMINTRSTEFYAPPTSLPLGLYRLIYTVQLTQRPQLVSTIQTSVRILRTAITVNLLPSGTSTMTRGQQQDIFFNPGQYSVDPDENAFDPTVRICFLLLDSDDTDC